MFRSGTQTQTRSSRSSLPVANPVGGEEIQSNRRGETRNRGEGVDARFTRSQKFRGKKIQRPWPLLSPDYYPPIPTVGASIPASPPLVLPAALPSGLPAGLPSVLPAALPLSFPPAPFCPSRRPPLSFPTSPLCHSRHPLSGIHLLPSARNDDVDAARRRVVKVVESKVTEGGTFATGGRRRDAMHFFPAPP